MKSNLQLIRKEAGFKSAREFATRMQMSARTYTNYEQGISKLTLEQAWLFADALGQALGRFVSLDELAGRDFPSATSPPLTAEERGLVRSFRSLDDPARRRVNRAIEGEVADIEAAAKNGEETVQDSVMRAG